jgi:hypothetical protein
MGFQFNLVWLNYSSLPMAFVQSVRKETQICLNYHISCVLQVENLVSEISDTTLGKQVSIFINDSDHN